MNGFVLGLVVGVLVTLMFTTKKGRQILRALTEEGLSRFTEVEDILHAMEDDDEFVGPMEEEMVDEPLESEMPSEEVVEEGIKTRVTKQPAHPLRRLTSGRKFFRKPVRK